MSFIDHGRDIASPEVASREMGLGSGSLDTYEHQSRDFAVEEVVSMVAAIYMYITSVHLRYQQLGLSEFYLSRPYHRIVVSLLIPITTLFGIRHPAIRFLQCIYYFIVII